MWPSAPVSLFHRRFSHFRSRFFIVLFPFRSVSSAYFQLSWWLCDCQTSVFLTISVRVLHGSLQGPVEWEAPQVNAGDLSMICNMPHNLPFYRVVGTCVKLWCLKGVFLAMSFRWHRLSFRVLLWRGQIRARPWQCSWTQAWRGLSWLYNIFGLLNWICRAFSWHLLLQQYAQRKHGCHILLCCYSV